MREGVRELERERESEREINGIVLRGVLWRINGE